MNYDSGKRGSIMTKEHIHCNVPLEPHIGVLCSDLVPLSSISSFVISRQQTLDSHDPMNSVSGKSVVTTPVLSYAHQSLGYHIVTIRFWKRSTLIYSLQNNSIATNTCDILQRIYYLSFRTLIC